MREFAKDEIIKYKCLVCGSRNKMYTELSFHGKLVGYNLRCCNCGDMKLFTSDNGAGIQFIESQLKPERSFCIQNSGCPHTECKLYGTCHKPPYPDKHPDKGCQHKKQDSDKLIVNAYQKPKFL